MLNGNRTKSDRGRSPRDFYITPQNLALGALTQFSIDEPHRMLSFAMDAGCGTGVWGKYASQVANSVYGIDTNPCVSDENMYSFDLVYTGDYLKYNGVVGGYGFDLICGNPPYSLAEQFIRHSFGLLPPDGYIYFLLRLSFLEGIARNKGLFKEFPIKRVYICSRRPSFFSTNGRHTTDTLAYAMFLWQKGYSGKTELSFLDWNYDSPR